MPDNTNALPIGSRLDKNFVVERILGTGGFGITYLAYNKRLDWRVAIKEYLPRVFAMREHGTVTPIPIHRDDFAKGLSNFLREAGILIKLGRLRHPSIVGVTHYFEENGTAYMVMQYEEGEVLSTLLAERGTLPEQQVLNILFPIIDGLALMHEQGLVHRDIKPANIFVRCDGSPVLLDFGTARDVQLDRELTVIFTPQYAPPEQFYGKGPQGAWTDIYSLGGVTYRMVTGNPPVPCFQRTLGHSKGEDPYLSAVGAAGYSRALLSAIDLALAYDADERPHTIADWRRRLEASPLICGADAARDDPGRNRRSGLMSRLRSFAWRWFEADREASAEASVAPLADADAESAASTSLLEVGDANRTPGNSPPPTAGSQEDSMPPAADPGHGAPAPVDRYAQIAAEPAAKTAKASHPVAQDESPVPSPSAAKDGIWTSSRPPEEPEHTPTTPWGARMETTPLGGRSGADRIWGPVRRSAVWQPDAPRTEMNPFVRTARTFEIDNAQEAVEQWAKARQSHPDDPEPAPGDSGGAGR